MGQLYEHQSESHSSLARRCIGPFNDERFLTGKRVVLCSGSKLTKDSHGAFGLRAADDERTIIQLVRDLNHRMRSGVSWQDVNICI